MVVDVNLFFQKQKHHHKSDKHHHKRDYHKTKGNEVITEQEEIENKHNIKHNQSSQLMMSKLETCMHAVGKAVKLESFKLDSYSLVLVDT